ncbi:hypothetical protein HanXRQr2_Chr15g0679821 [Helianthus annuus]|uniref:Uncharacterized protein n=1 Tax=Helianthus annuus TaxID=4232 RepID=A0A9K3H3G8_HELAN|nr:hypothetical protein HanXRQr2_Chr15g0679821 [Helianthus annuus]
MFNFDRHQILKHYQDNCNKISRLYDTKNQVLNHKIKDCRLAEFKFNKNRLNVKKTAIRNIELFNYTNKDLWLVIFRWYKGHFGNRPFIRFPSDHNLHFRTRFVQSRLNIPHANVLLQARTKPSASNLTDVLPVLVLNLTVTTGRWAC